MPVHEEGEISITPLFGHMAHLVFSLHKIKMAQSKNWCFTLNNYTDDEFNYVVALPSTYLVVGKEVGQNGTPHLQGFIRFNVKKRLPTVKNIIARAHWEVARQPKAAIVYCKKDNDYVEKGTSLWDNQGKRSDLDQFKEDVKSRQFSLLQLKELHTGVYARYRLFFFEYCSDHILPPVPVDHPLRPWQVELQELLLSDPNDRSIVFVVDKDGNNGKSWFANVWMSRNYETTQILTPGKGVDLAFAAKTSCKYFFLDCPRSRQGEFICYDFLEGLKNGRIFCPKYESRMKYFPKMHVVVLTNSDPDFTKLSEDRYVVINI